MIRKPIIIRYKDLEQLVKVAYLIKSPAPLTGWMPEPIIFQTGSGKKLKGKKYHVTWNEYLKRIREKSKIWGITNSGKKLVIRYWVSSEATEKDIIEFFAHEIGHHMGRAYVDEMLEEKKAVSYERVAGLAYDIAKLVQKEDRVGYNKPKKGKK